MSDNVDKLLHHLCAQGFDWFGDDGKPAFRCALSAAGLEVVEGDELSRLYSDFTDKATAWDHAIRIPRKVQGANERVGKWLSAALEDPAVCAEMKADIEYWFKAIKPPRPSALTEGEG